MFYPRFFDSESEETYREAFPRTKTEEYEHNITEAILDRLNNPVDRNKMERRIAKREHTYHYPLPEDIDSDERLQKILQSNPRYKNIIMIGPIREVPLRSIRRPCCRFCCYRRQFNNIKGPRWMYDYVRSLK